MFPRMPGWILAVATVVLTAPARSDAAIEVLIQELDGSNNIVSSQTFSGVNVPTSASPYNPGVGSYTGISLTYSTPNPSPSNFNSLTSTVSLQTSATFDASHTLQVVVTEDGFLNSNVGGDGIVTNNPSASYSFFGAISQVTGTTELLSGSIGSLTSLGATAPTTGTSAGGAGQTFTNVSGVPGQFAFTQTMLIKLTPTAGGPGIAPNTNFSGTLSSGIQTTPAQVVVPAPAGLVLGLIALPVLGLRKALRKKPVA